MGMSRKKAHRSYAMTHTRALPIVLPLLSSEKASTGWKLVFRKSQQKYKIFIKPDGLGNFGKNSRSIWHFGQKTITQSTLQCRVSFYHLVSTWVAKGKKIRAYPSSSRRETERRQFLFWQCLRRNVYTVEYFFRSMSKWQMAKNKRVFRGFWDPRENLSDVG